MTDSIEAREVRALFGTGIDEPLYYAALEAEAEFTRHLIRVYGKARASERRYQVTPHADADLRRAGLARGIACVEWGIEMARWRGDAVSVGQLEVELARLRSEP